MTVPTTLESGELVVRGRVVAASNTTFYAEVDGVEVAYKPIAGERPLWDFPDGRLAEREVAAYLVSEALGWGIVPETVLRDGPFGEGMVQRWCHSDPHQQAVTVQHSGPVPQGWRHVLEAEDDAGRDVMLLHEDSPELRRIAVFDVLVNNADRKGGHVLEVEDGSRVGIDHGICFHSEPKLRTVLWGWAGEPLTDQERSSVARLRADLEGVLGESLGFHLATWDLEALAGRCEDLLRAGTLPLPKGDWRDIPWPPF